MKKISFKKFLINYFNIILVNFFFADVCVVTFIWGILLYLLDSYLELPYSDNMTEYAIKYNNELANFFWISFIIIVVMFCFLKLLVLPIFYNMLETKSKNVSIVKFIKNVKHKWVMKLLVLFVSIMPFLLWKMLNNSLLTKEIWYCFFFFCIVFGLFGSYLFLFFWWEIEKWWKRDCDKWYGSKRIKNTQLYLEINKIFNKIQDFNYQNLKKCQKIVFVIVTLIFKWSGKVGLKINKVLKTKII